MEPRTTAAINVSTDATEWPKCPHRTINSKSLGEPRRRSCFHFGRGRLRPYDLECGPTRFTHRRNPSTRKKKEEMRGVLPRKKQNGYTAFTTIAVMDEDSRKVVSLGRALLRSSAEPRTTRLQLLLGVVYSLHVRHGRDGTIGTHLDGLFRDHGVQAECPSRRVGRQVASRDAGEGGAGATSEGESRGHGAGRRRTAV